MMNVDSEGRLKRFEYRGKYLRASRTGGTSLRAQAKAAGLNFTVNSKHGVRVSTRVAKGTNVGIQNGKFVLRGRYGKGPTKLNISKSGFSVSTKTGFGTINWFKPRYSSAKIAGIQVRGKKAIYAHLIAGLLRMTAVLCMVLAQAVIWLFQALYWLLIEGNRLVRELYSEHQEKKLQVLEESWSTLWDDKPPQFVLSSLMHCLFLLGTGYSKPPSGYQQDVLKLGNGEGALGGMLAGVSNEVEEASLSAVHAALCEAKLKPLTRLETFFGTLVEVYRQKVSEDALRGGSVCLDSLTHFLSGTLHPLCCLG